MRYLKGVASVRIDADRCAGCGTCTTVCPHAVIAVRDKKALVADRDACMECGACQTNCPRGAVSVEAGVGCAYAIVRGMVLGTAPDCGCGCGSEEKPSDCC